MTAGHQQSDPVTKSLPAACRARKSAPRRIRRKHSYSSSVRPATAISTASTILKPTNFKRRQSLALARDSSQEQRLYDTDDGITDDLGDKDYDNHSNASSKTTERSPPPKRLRGAKDSSTTYHDLEKDSAIYSFKLADQAAAATLSTAMPQSKEIPVCGFLTLKTFESRVIYCFSFSQELSLQPCEIYNVISRDRRNSE